MVGEQEDNPLAKFIDKLMFTGQYNNQVPSFSLIQCGKF